MANVQFYRLGMTNAVSRATYELYTKTDGSCDGNIVFARVDEKGTWNVDSSVYKEPQLYIWANGVEYKIADKAALDYVMRVLENLNADDQTPGSIAYLIAQALEASKPVFTVGSTDPEVTTTTKHGDYYIKEVTLTDNSKERTAYIYDENFGWRALDGNIDAEHVIINSAITLSGNYTEIGNMKRGDVVAAGTTVKKLFDDILALEVYPSSLSATYSFTSTAANPTISIYKAGTTTAAAASVEVGTMVDLKAVFGAQSAAESVEAKTFNNGTSKGYSTDKTEATYVNAEKYTQDLSGDITSSTSDSSLHLIGLGNESSAALGNDATISKVYVPAGQNIISATQSNITYSRNFDNLTEKTLYAVSNIGNYSDSKSVSISKTFAIAATEATKTAENTSSTKTITGYWPIYWGYVTEGATTFSSNTFTVNWIKANKEGKKASFNLPQELSTLAPTDTKKCYGIWVALPFDNAAATASWDVVNKATSAPVNMATDTKKAVNGMTSDVDGTTCSDTKNYVVQYWVNGDPDFAANTYTIAKA